METNQQPTELIDTTVSALTDGGITSIVPTDGVSLINSWLKVLGESPATQQIHTSLEELKSQLESGYPDPVTVRNIIFDLSEQLNVQASSAAHEYREPLRKLSDAIQGFASSL